METEQGYIGYILRYEPDPEWYNNQIIYQHGEYMLDMTDYQGDITKYSFEREVIWSTIEENVGSSTASRGGQFIEVCVISLQSACSGIPWDCGGSICGFERVENCQTVWSSGGQGNEGDGSGDGDGSNNGGGDGSDPCITTGTTIIDNQPISGIGTGCTPNDGTGVLPTLASDCNKLADLSNSPTYQLRMQELIANTTGNTEILYYGKTYDNGNTIYNDQERYEGQPDVVGVDAPFPSSKIDSFIHNHFNNGNGTLSVFSGSDLYSLYQLYINNKIDDLSKFIMVVTTPGNNIASTEDDTVYAMTIANGTEFAAFGAKYLVDPIIVDNLLYDSQDNRIDKNISNSINEERFTRMLQSNNSGLNIYRGDRDDLSSWTQLRIKSDNSLKENNCN